MSNPIQSIAVVSRRPKSLLFTFMWFGLIYSSHGQNKNLIDEISFKIYEMERLDSSTSKEVWKLSYQNQTLLFSACSYSGSTTFNPDIDGDNDDDNIFNNNIEQQGDSMYSFCHDDDCLVVRYDDNQILVKWMTDGEIIMTGIAIGTNCD